MQGKGRRSKHHKKTCRAESIAQTCNGKCGRVTNNCQKTIDCGSCACEPACAACDICQEFPDTPGTCVIDPAQQDRACGSAGKVCQPDGTCRCVPLTECPAGKECGGICADGQCVTGIGRCAERTNVCTAPCNGNPNCFCIPTRAGDTRCALYDSDGGFLRPCTSDAQCTGLGPGAFCPPQFDSCGGVSSLPCWAVAA